MHKITYLCLAFLLCFSLPSLATNETFATSTISTNIQRVRIDFVTPKGFTRHLLLGFTQNNIASDGVDYGYDARNMDNLPDDMNWLIEDERYLIQGVGAFEKTKRFPLGIFLSNSGQIQIALTDLENFDIPIEVFVYDSLNDTYSQINSSNYIETLDEGIYKDRYYLTFASNDSEFLALSTKESQLSPISIHHSKSSNQLIIKGNERAIDKVECFDILGKQLFSYSGLSTYHLKIPLGDNSTNILLVNIHQGIKRTSKRIIVSR